MMSIVWPVVVMLMMVALILGALMILMRVVYSFGCWLAEKLVKKPDIT